MNRSDLKQLADEMISAGFFTHYVHEQGYMAYFTSFRTISCFDNSQHPTVEKLLQKIGSEVGRHQASNDFAVNTIRNNLSHCKNSEYVAILGVLYLITHGHLSILYSPSWASNPDKTGMFVHPIRPGSYKQIDIALTIKEQIQDSALQRYYNDVEKYVTDPSMFNIQQKLLLVNKDNLIVPTRLRFRSDPKGGYATTIQISTAMSVSIDLMSEALAALIQRTLKRWFGTVFYNRHRPCTIEATTIQSWINQVNSLSYESRLQLSGLMINTGLDCGEIRLTTEIPALPVRFLLEEHEHR